ncbi:MAG: translation initiation factor IF-2 [Candidatus Kaiserbacteria bacterium]|nr:translation initiation factor IF-2 [Candidatus Kaiserbacteria bacterium]
MIPKNSLVTERPPIVAVMGHVDHGKSTLLDFIRHANVVGGEAGGITQHVAAYEVEHVPSSKSGESAGKPKRITFIDTPGHAAFKAIRARGANVADIAILVVAADDGVKEQTLEALESIRNAGTPFIVAINKIDKPNANIEKTQATLMENKVYLETLGGDVPWAAISAKTGDGVAGLLDLILLVAEVEGLKGDSSLPAEGFVIEAHRDPKRGIAATLIITNGTLLSGQALLAGRAIAPVRIMENFAGLKIRQANISSPVILTGFDELPVVGESFQTFTNKRDAEEARSAGMQKERMSPSPVQKNLASNAEAESDQFRMPIVVRADTSGSLEAVVHEVNRIGDAHARVVIVLSGIGNISENDIKAAASSSPSPAFVFGFNVEADALGIERARQHGIQIEKFNIIYKMVERIQEILRASAPKRIEEQVIGNTKVMRQFSSRKGLHVVGGSVADGYLAKGASVRVTRRGTVIGLGKIKSLQTNKQNTDRVEAGSEFGAQIEAVFEIAQGDSLECFVNVSK